MAPETRAMEIKQLEETFRYLVQNHESILTECSNHSRRSRQNASNITLTEAIQSLDNKYKEDLAEINGSTEERSQFRSINQARILGTPNHSPATSSGMRNSALQMFPIPQPSMETLLTLLPKIEFPKFSGDNVMGWTFRCGQFFEISLTPNEWKVKLASIYLDGIALEWHQNFVRINSTSIDWNVYKEAIKERFGETAYDDPTFELHTLKQTIGVQDYKNQFDALLTRLDLFEKYAISCYLGGLMEELLGLVRLMNPKSLREAFNLAKIQESNLTQQQKKYKSWSKLGIMNSSGSIENVLNKTAQIGGSNIQLKESPRSMLPNSTFDERRAKGLCFWCNEKYTQGHQCKRRQLYQISLSGEVAPLSEIEEPHIEEMIEEEVEPETETKVSLNAITGIPSFHTMIVVGTIKRRKICILIDSGSTHNFLDPSVLSVGAYAVESIPKQHVRLANGDKILLSEQIKNFHWQMQGITFTTNVLMMPLESYHMVLGIQWLSKLGMVNWDFKELKMSFLLNNKPVFLCGTRTPFLQLVNEKHMDKALRNSSTALYVCFYTSKINSEEKTLVLQNQIKILSGKQQDELNSLLEIYAEVLQNLKNYHHVGLLIIKLC
ncbi:hypothetical protein AXF42_Ash003332 [Apostasia shenzhenica]|uniref:Retrotransposon gag domain-containing protein n=1 Tax=Apostasia shenzhenica TaxID=1088818 RepID=A0A2I0BFU3_9ASPA|nr:hypothetical protein AXF42_Ash003332 [Apostasia shenzhenica]